ncbi:relaxase/mobilization nuclease domain-containing protein, partial [Klebsiella pneumoniae]|uniref:relaxase/mobilization nuclease domain-containing protein n=1 Tax=Klebsiella pneumoniae TaxID=573 RepID=UPI0032DD2AC4
MKGMQQIKRGSGFRGVVSYALDNDNGQELGEVIGGNMSGRTLNELSSEFGVSRKLRPDVKKPVWHNSLRLPEGDKLTEEQWTKIADDYMSRMGFSDKH